MSVGEQFGTQLVVADGADGEAFRAVLGRGIGEFHGLEVARRVVELDDRKIGGGVSRLWSLCSIPFGRLI